jgi:hypothetical protein
MNFITEYRFHKRERREVQSDRKVQHITVSNTGLMNKLQDIQHLRIMLITLHPNQTMSLQHMIEMGSLFCNACASPFYHV